MYPLDEFRNCLDRVQRLLQASQVGFHLTGGVAAIAYGDPRMTQDIDVVVDAVAMQNSLEMFLELLQSDQFLYHDKAIRDAVHTGRQFQLIDKVSTFKIDLSIHGS